jgi:DNA-binding transcriptional MerR regulator
MSKLLTISQVAEASGLSADTIRYYERVGVLPRVQRGGNAYRGYCAEHVETLRFARRLRELGLAPAAMSDLIRLFHDGTCGQMRNALLASVEQTLAKIREQRVELERVEAQLKAVLHGLEGQTLDNHRLATVTPCVCVAVLQEEGSP